MAASFEIREAREQDLEEIAHIKVLGYDQIPMLKLMVQDMEPSFLNEFQISSITKMFKQQSYKYFVAVDVQNAKVAGWTALSVPTVPNVPQSVSGMLWPSGINEKLASHFYGLILTKGKDYGYDPAKHFRLGRAGTFVHPDYQKKGLGTELTRHCNKISDAAGCSTYITALSSSIRMFLNEGFVELGSMDTQLEEFGGQTLFSRSHYCWRQVKQGVEEPRCI